MSGAFTPNYLGTSAQAHTNETMEWLIEEDRTHTRCIEHSIGLLIEDNMTDSLR